ncbi:MAG: hypothetical protein M3Z80_09155, partial [Apibacter sp.]|nr:hypothetical protein [Apibacter sp.]
NNTLKIRHSYFGNFIFQYRIFYLILLSLLCLHKDTKNEYRIQYRNTGLYQGSKERPYPAFYEYRNY